MPGTHAQNVIGVALELHDLPPASTDADADADPDALDEVPPADGEPELLQAASKEAAATPASTAAGRLTVRFIGDLAPSTR
jgi:hypothetical protein